MSLPDPRDRPYVTVDELLELVELPLGRSSIYEAIRRGEWPHVRFGSKILLPVAQLAALFGVGYSNEHGPSSAGPKQEPAGAIDPGGLTDPERATGHADDITRGALLRAVD